MKRFVKVCVGSTALALGVAVAPMAAQAGVAAHGRFLPFHMGKTGASHTVNFLAASREAATRHPAIAAAARQLNPSAVAAQRATAVNTGGRRAGVVSVAAARSSLRAVAPATTLAAFPTMSLSQQVSAFGSDQNLQPPDTQVAAGPTAVAEATNSTLSVWSKSGSLLGATDLNAFFQVPSAQSFTDPRLLYDAQSGRWFLSGWSLDATLTNTMIYIAVSATSNPAGSWTVYPFVNGSGELTDQPMIGVCNDKVVMAWNDFTNTTSGAVYNFAAMIAFQKSDLVARVSEANLHLSGFIDPEQFRFVPAQSLAPTSTCWLTVNDADPTLVPSGSTVPPGTIGVISLTGTPLAGNLAANETFPSIAATNPPPAPAQPSGTTNDTQNDDRFLSAVWQDNQLWTSATDACTPTGDTATRNCLRLIEVRTSGSTPSRVVDEDVSTAGVDEYYPAVSLSYAGDLSVSYTASSSTLFPGAYAIVSPSVSGTAFTAPITIQAGAASYNGGSSARWGDYSAAAADPSQPGAVWVGAEYAPSDAASGNWGTAAAEVTLAAAPAMAVGVEGSDGALWVQAPQLGSGWHSRGGKIVGPPAVVARPNSDGTTPASPLFISTGTNKLLYIAGLTGAWQRVGPNTASCLGSPGAMIIGTTLWVACEGTNRALYYNTATMPTSGMPQFNNPWKYLGGVLTAGPAVAPIGGTMTFFVRGTNGHIYTRTTTAGYTQGPWTCLGSPAAAEPSAAGPTIFACQGTNHALYMSINGGAGWGPTTSLGGTLAAGPAIAATSRVPFLLGEGSNRAIFERTPATGWTSLGGVVLGGVGAVALN